MAITNTAHQNIDLKEKALEKYLQWMEEILEQPIKPSENFIDVGGHSMIAISLNERVKKEFGVIISMEHLFNDPLNEVFTKAI